MTNYTTSQKIPLQITSDERLRDIEISLLKQKHQLDYILLIVKKIADKQGVKL